MAALVAKSAASSAVLATRQSRNVAIKPSASLKPAVRAVPAVSAKANKMMVWQPVNNKFFETFSFLPPLTDDQIAKQVDYIVGNGWVPCLEFAPPSQAYIGDASTVRFGNAASTYQDNRYWTMWKLPMFGCRDAMQVLKEIVACTKAFPDAYVRIVAFDAVRQVQITGFLVQKPPSAKECQPVNKRQVA